MRRAPGPVVALAAAAIAAGSLAGAAEPKTGPGGSIGPGNIKAFASEFDRTFGAAMKPLFVRLSALRPAGGGQKRDVSLTLKGKTGTMRVAGFGLVLPAPPRWDLTLTFGNFSALTRKRPALRLRGALQFNVVTPRSGRGTSPVGLFRGFLTLSGRFGGTAEVYGEVESGKIVSLVVTSKGKRLLVGSKAPRDLVAYVSTVAKHFKGPTGVAVAPDGRVYVAENEGNAIGAISPTGQVSTLVKGLRQPSDVALDGKTLIASANDENSPLASIDTSSGALTPIIGPIGKISFGFFSGLPLCNDTCDGFTPMAGLPHPNGIDVEGGVIFIAQNELPPSIRMATRSGSIHTLRDLRGSCGLMGVGGPDDLARGLNGDIYFVAALPGCYAVMVMHSDGSFGVLAGEPKTSGNAEGSAAKARFFNPEGLVFDGARYLYVSDTGNDQIKRVDVLTGDVVRVAGCVCGRAGFIDGPSDAATWTFNLPSGLALDAWGDLYVADRYNGAVRLVRIVTDPARDPQIRRFEPYALLRGSHSTIAVTGENLGLAQSASLGEGIGVKIVSQSSKTLQLDVSISATAPVGTHTLSVKTFYGKVDTPPGLSLQVLDQTEAQVTVATIAGTGSWSPGVHDGPAIKQPFAFPTGLAALDSGRLVIADPLEQRLRFVGSKDGTERELVYLLLNNSGSTSALSAALAPLGTLGQLLGSLGATPLVGKATSALLMPIVKAAVDQYCTAISDPCTWIELPWAGTIAPGESQGFRMSAQMFLPVDVAASEPGVVFAADTGNGRPVSIGLDPRPSTASKSPTNLFNVSGVAGRPFGVADAGGNAMYVAVPDRNRITRVDLKNGGAGTLFAGNDNSSGCEQRSGEPKHPLGLPLGMDATKDDLFVADPFCGTVWKIAKKDGSVKDMRGPLASLGAGGSSCSDGPVAFATFGAPVDVAVDKDGNIWVADAGCNSIREIKDVWAKKETAAITGALKGMLGGLAGRLPASTVGRIQDAIDSAQPDFVEANRWWVITVAGSREGVGGFRDGLAGQSLFSGPMGITTAPGTGGVTYVYVSDTGNKRVRMISVPG